MRLKACRETLRVFWTAIGAGASTEDAAAAVGVSVVVGYRWFRQSGGMPPLSLAPLQGRYLSLAEREEIAVGVAAGDTLRQIAERLGRAPSTVSRELHRNVRRRHLCEPPAGSSRRGPRGLGPLRYRAVVAQQRADRRAARPKPRS